MAKILIVDSDPVSARAIESHLHEGNHEADLVDSSEAALKLLGNCEYPIVVIGNASNFSQSCRKISELESSPAVFVLSTEADVSNTVKALEAGATDFLKQPYHPIEFLARIRAILRRATYASLGDKPACFAS